MNGKEYKLSSKIKSVGIFILISLFFGSCKIETEEVYTKVINSRENSLDFKNLNTKNIETAYYKLLDEAIKIEHSIKFKENLENFTLEAFRNNDSTNIYRSQVIRFYSKNYDPKQDYYKDLLRAKKYFSTDEKFYYELYLTHSCLSRFYLKKQFYNQALSECYLAKKSLTTFHDKYLGEILGVNLTMANIFTKQKKFEEASSMLNDVKILFIGINTQLYSTTSLNYFKAEYYNNLAILDLDQKKYSHVLDHLHNALYHIRQNKNSVFLKSLIVSNVVKYKLENKDFDSLDYYINNLVESTNPYLHMEESQYNFLLIPEYKLLKKDTLGAINDYKKILSENKLYQNKTLEVTVYENLITKTDSISTRLKNDYLKSIKDKDDAFANENRVTQKISLENENIATKNNFIKKINYYIVLISISFLIIVAIIVYFIFQRNNNNVLKFINKYNETDETTYKAMLNYKYKLDKKSRKNRNNLSMELHDGILNKLFTARFTFLQNLDSGENKIKSIDLLRDTLNQLKHLSDNNSKLNAEMINNTFYNVVIELIENQPSETINFTYFLDPNINGIKFNDRLKLNLYRIIQEVLQNIHIHSNATEAFLSINYTEGSLIILIRDNGVGIDLDKAKKGIGLVNIYKRVKEINGKLSVNSSNGTVFKIEIIIK